MESYISHSPSQTEGFAKKLASRLKSGDILAMRGGMGVGKTAFVRGLADGLASYGEVSSPTYSIVNVYTGDMPLYHFDMYRITDMDELYTTGFFDYSEQHGICAIEWSENITWALPANVINVDIERISDDERRITINGGDRF